MGFLERIKEMRTYMKEMRCWSTTAHLLPLNLKKEMFCQQFFSAQIVGHKSFLAKSKYFWVFTFRIRQILPRVSLAYEDPTQSPQ